MTRSDDQRLDDIVAVIGEMAEMVGRGRPAFDRDIALRRGLERCLEVLGEAAKTLSHEVRASIGDVPWQNVIRLRDLLSHHYHRVEADQVWVTAEADVPRLAAPIDVWRERRGRA